ncbi:hypothetical protein ASF61_20170 [Duganella sp. Leaf126]|uniref:hypothetical protein n=1 Tax=Duganella sp. Leaf126 TaxID=1736266 RepID=UPI000701574B|nr:hypothetical protein [Duganella sp. Leaf126]KQQ45281.1 hypothetical protein ASF61_20170 [Duganella sp. Leaf126]
MSRRLSLAALLACTLGSAAAATLPSNLMLPDPELAAHGIVERWTLTIKLESDDLKAIAPCRQVLTERGFAPVLSKMASSSQPQLHFKIEGSKEYPQATTEADDALAAVQQARCKTAVNWVVVARQLPR